MDFTWHFGAGRMIPLHSLTARLTGVYKTDLISTREACRFTPVLEFATQDYRLFTRTVKPQRRNLLGLSYSRVLTVISALGFALSRR
jgi:hypothetical protein